MKRYIIIDKEGRKLHSNNYFYDCIMGGFGVNLVIYKSNKSAEKRATQVGGYVVTITPEDKTITDAIKKKLSEIND